MAPDALRMPGGLLTRADADLHRGNPQSLVRPGELPPVEASRDDGVYAVEWQMTQSPPLR